MTYVPRRPLPTWDDAPAHSAESPKAINVNVLKAGNKRPAGFAPWPDDIEVDVSPIITRPDGTAFVNVTPRLPAELDPDDGA